MSVVTNVVFSYSIGEDISDRTKDVNRYFAPLIGLVSCDNMDRAPRGWYGGTKMLETPLFIGSYNHLHLPDLLDHLRTIDWKYPEDVQLIVQEQDDNRFTILTLEDHE